MKKINLIVYIVLFGLFQLTYLALMTTKADVLFETKKHVMLFAIAFVALSWFAYGLWRDTSTTFLEKMESNQLYWLMQDISLITWLMVGLKMYNDYHTTNFYLEQKPLFLIVAFLFVISVDIWMKVAYTRIFMLISTLRDLRNK